MASHRFSHGTVLASPPVMAVLRPLLVCSLCAAFLGCSAGVQKPAVESALSDRRRTELAKEMTEQVLEAAGLAPDDAIRVWVLMHVVAEGSWAAAGGIVRFEQLREAAKAEREYSPAP